ncbi:MAG: surface lipoprotein assembly modifier [Vitreimonas sp.]
MALKRKLAVWRAVLLATSVAALAFASGAPAHAEDLNELNAQILANPQDAALNLHYAQVAEEQGKLRLALAAYERILINNPDNADAQHGYERVRRILEPTRTSFRVEFGEQWDSNPLDSSVDNESAYTTFVNGTWVDERRFGARRWRTLVNFQVEVTPEIDELNYGYVGASIGPIIDLTPSSAAIPAIGFAVSSFSNVFYYDEINAGVTVEGHRDSLTYWTRLRAGWRDYGEDSTATQGAYAELMGGLSVPRIFSDNDSLFVVPWVRWSGIQGTAHDFLEDPIAPGEYAEYGAEATYRYRLNDHLFVSAGVQARDRYYSRTEVAGKNRHDTYVAPKAGITLWNPLSCSCGLTLSYQYRNNNSNDPFSDYDAQQTTFSISRQF